MKKIGLAFGLFLSPFILLLFIEAFLRILLGPPPGDINPIISDPIINHKWKPNLTYVDASRGIFPYTLYTNRQSWVERNDINPHKQKNTIRIFYLGDSNVQGVVPEENKMVNLVEKGLNNRVSEKGKKVEVINTGTSSWSPSLYYILITRTLMKYSPDIVVINVDMTDVRDDAVYQKLTTYNDNGMPVAVRPSDEKNKTEYTMTPQGIVKVDMSQKNIDMLRKSSAVVYHFTRLYEHLSKNNTLRKFFFKSEASTIPPVNDDNWVSQKWSETGKKNAAYSMKLLGYAIDYLHEHNVKVIVTGVPHYPQFNGVWSTRPHQIIKQTTEKHNAMYFNSYEALKDSISTSKQTDYYWDIDPTHFNARGNEIWANAYIKYLLNPQNKIFDNL